MITIQLQPHGSKTCGQHCVAMVAGVPVAESIEVFGHKHSTETKDQVAALKYLGLETAPKYRRYKLKNDLPKLCIIRMKHLAGSGSHVAVYHNGFVYCPTYGVFKYTSYVEWVKNTMRPVYFLEIFQHKICCVA